MFIKPTPYSEKYLIAKQKVDILEADFTFAKMQEARMGSQLL